MPLTLAHRLEKLFADTAGDKGRPVTLQEIVDRMKERGIAPMSLSYLQQLRSGQATNPRVQHLRALADAFGVPLSYFVEEEEKTDAAEAKLTEAERNIALRVHGLSSGALASISSIIDIARRSEQLDDVPGEEDEP
ncbi:transcriptional regulator [Nocardiopsis metallicus]|uniref:Transcriptional regulator with XRE-family HTH domain n=1 Tax=Nocardiopsis metallicus TaxID=179819 RepID=A0A840W3E9_9ACTN|nr:transcriptional regulator [Nocardiopsis metallicus]MBB5491389.1 transcriptional regulator with XRE-family HTH domain [Nocardiopsis metallicus]